MPQIGWFKPHKKIFFSILEAGNPRSKYYSPWLQKQTLQVWILMEAFPVCIQSPERFTGIFSLLTRTPFPPETSLYFSYLPKGPVVKYVYTEVCHEDTEGT